MKCISLGLKQKDLSQTRATKLPLNLKLLAQETLSDSRKQDSPKRLVKPYSSNLCKLVREAEKIESALRNLKSKWKVEVSHETLMLKKTTIF